MVVDEDSSIMTNDISGLANLLGPLVAWDSPSLGVRVDLLWDLSGIGIYDDKVGLWLGSELGLPLGSLTDSETWSPFGLQLIVDTHPG